MIDCREEPKRTRRRLFTTAAATSVLLAILVIWGLSAAGTNLHLSASLPDTTDTPPLVPDMELLREAAGEDSLLTSVRRTAVVRGPVDEGPAGLTVGERLKRLDSLMLVVPADSLPDLMAEYEELLDSALNVQYSGPEDRPSYASEPRTATPRSNDVSRAAAPNRQRSTPRSRVTVRENRVAVTSTDAEAPTHAQSRQPTEPPTPSATPAPSQAVSENSTQPVRQEPVRQRRNDGYVRSTPRSSVRSNRSLSATQPDTESTSGTTATSRSTTSQTTTRSLTARSDADVLAERSNSGTGEAVRPQRQRHAGRADGNRREADRQRMREHRVERQGRMRSEHRNRSRARAQQSTRTPEESIGRKYTEGLARFRAGQYRQAVDLLAAVVRSGSAHSQTARYYLAVSLERSGKTQAAIRHYRALRESSGSIGEKSWFSMARLMAKSGQASRARAELRRFTSSHSSSRYVEEARRLLEDL